MAGPENAKKYQTGIFLAGSASAEFFADIGLCPFEAVKVRAVTSTLLQVLRCTGVSLCSLCKEIHRLWLT